MDRIRVAIHRVTFWLAVSCLAALVLGLVLEIGWQVSLFEGYIGGFFVWAFIFALINAYTKPILNH